jgi:hypothetical protein
MDVGPVGQMAGEGGVVDQRDVTEDVGRAPKASTEAKKKPCNFFRAVSPANDMEIYEGKVVAVDVRDIEVTSPETGYLCIRCQGDDQFHIPSHVADCFQCADIILHGNGEPQLPQNYSNTFFLSMKMCDLKLSSSI